MTLLSAFLIIEERRSGLPCWRRDADKQHRAMPYAI